jgi:hypothetical protein
LVVLLMLVALVGCQRRPETAPVRGTVTFKGKPLTFGGVMFQPAGGQPARGEIRPDGSFELSTYVAGDGAAVGPHRVRITCFEGQNPQLPPPPPGIEPALGKSLIPQKYTLLDTSGLTATVEPSRTNEVRFQLE